MFKDYDKYLKTSLKVYLFVLVIVFIMKLVGLDYFGLDVNNPIMLKLNKIVWHFKIREIWYCFTLWLYAYIILSVVSKNKKVKLNALIITIIDVICILTIKYKMIKIFRYFLDAGILYLGCFISGKDKFKNVFKRIPYNEIYIGEFAENHPVGKYLITTNNHITPCVNGYVIDTWDCTNKKIEYIWKIS